MANNFFAFFNYWSKRSDIFFFSRYVIKYTVQLNLLLELILDLGKYPNKKTHESESTDFFSSGTSGGPKSLPKADLIEKYT